MNTKTLKVLSRLKAVASPEDKVKQMLLDFGATAGNAYGAQFTVSKSQLRAFQTMLTKNGFTFLNSSTVVNKDLKLAIVYRAVGPVIGVTIKPYTVAEARYISLAKRPIGEDLSQDKVLPALGEGLRAALGTLKETNAKPLGKYSTKVFVGQPNKARDVSGVLKELDFVVSKLDTQKLVSGVRMEASGKVTFVQYSTVSGVLTVSTNINDIDI